MDRLGNFLMSIYHKPLSESPNDYYLSTKVTNDTRMEMNTFLNSVLVNLTGEKDLTWNLLNAMDLVLVTGI